MLGRESYSNKLQLSIFYSSTFLRDLFGGNSRRHQQVNLPSPTDLQFFQLRLNGEPVSGSVGADGELVEGVLQPGAGLGVDLAVLVVVLNVLLVALQQVLQARREMILKHTEAKTQRQRPRDKETNTQSAPVF